VRGAVRAKRKVDQTAQERPLICTLKVVTKLTEVASRWLEEGKASFTQSLALIIDKLVCQKMLSLSNESGYCRYQHGIGDITASWLATDFAYS
jgi:hypothetical protein